MKKLAFICLALAGLVSAEPVTPIKNGKLQSALNADGNRIIGLPAPASANDPARLNDLQAVIEFSNTPPVITHNGQMWWDTSGMGTLNIAKDFNTSPVWQAVGSANIWDVEPVSPGFVYYDLASFTTRSITGPDLTVSAGGRILGSSSSSLSGFIAEKTPSQVLDWISSTQGSLLYRGALSWGALGPGTSGQVLVSGGAGANPSWSHVAWSHVDGTPTTLAGYGITDGVASTRTVNGHALSSNVTVTSADLGLATVATSGGYSDLTGLPTLGTLAALSTVGSAQITDGSIVNADISASAGIALSKLATDPLARANHTGTQAVSTLTGTLPVANGGTGQSTFTNGQILIGNTTGNTLAKATITAGSNVSITNGAGSITIGLTGVQTTSGTLALGGFGAVTGALNIANGGTGATNAIAAINALLPSQAGNSGKVLGTNGTDAAWVDDATGGGGGASAPWTWVAGEHSATNGERLLVNTGGGSTIDILLPASPSDLDSVEILDAQVTPFTSTSGANVFSWSKNIIYNGADIGNLASLRIAGTHCICVFSALADKWTISTISGAVSLAGKALDGGTAPDTGWGVVFDALTNKFSFGPPTVLFGAGGFASAPAVRADASAGNPVLGFFGKAASGETLSAQPTAGIAGTGMVFQGGSGFADSGTSITIASDIVTNASTFGGDIGSSAYTINDVVRALKLLGLLAQ